MLVYTSSRLFGLRARGKACALHITPENPGTTQARIFVPMKARIKVLVANQEIIYMSYAVQCFAIFFVAFLGAHSKLSSKMGAYTSRPEPELQTNALLQAAAGRDSSRKS